MVVSSCWLGQASSRMIDYDQRTLAGIPLIFQLAGSMFKRCIYPAFCSVALTFMLKMLRTNGYEIWGEPVFNHPFPYQLYTFLLGFMLVFRTTLTYQRFWHGRTMLELMSSKWGDVALQVPRFGLYRPLTRCTGGHLRLPVQA